LEQGELVEILETVNSGGQNWYKIAPPSGEFRWISAQYVDRHRHDGVSQPRSELRLAAEGDSVPLDNQLPANDESIAIPGAATSGVSSPSRLQPTSSTLTPIQQTSAEAPLSAVPHANQLLATTPAEMSADLMDQVDLLELELSKMATEEPTVWRFDDLAAHAEQLLAQAQSAVERGRVRQVLHRVARLEDIKIRYDRIVGLQAETDLQNRTLSAVIANSSSRGQVDPSQFDASGVLKPVVSRRADAPNYAVVDDKGDVLAFISPAPDVNLQPYLGARIGVSGSRGFIPQYNRPHVMAQRVTPLDVARR
jgi:hypothetical protein